MEREAGWASAEVMGVRSVWSFADSENTVPSACEYVFPSLRVAQVFKRRTLRRPVTPRKKKANLEGTYILVPVLRVRGYLVRIGVEYRRFDPRIPCEQPVAAAACNDSKMALGYFLPLHVYLVSQVVVFRGKGAGCGDTCCGSFLTHLSANPLGESNLRGHVLTDIH